MKIDCAQIASALNTSKISGNEILEVTHGWSQVKEDFRMKSELTPALKEKIQLEQPDLEYWRAASDSHYEADEGFICHEHSVSISFPVKK